METTAYYAYGLPIYIAILLIERRVMLRKGERAITFATAFGNLSAGFGTIVIGLFLGPVLIALYLWALKTFALVRWPSGSLGPWVLAFVFADFGHYWHHRMDHRVAALWAVHGVHHMPEEMNFSVAMRHAWFSDLYSFPFYAPLPLLGVPMEHFFIATTALSFHALITHTEHFRFPSFGFLVTPASHSLHHARNERYIDKNFGAMFCLWDKLFGTHVVRDPDVPPEYGTPSGYRTHDGALAQFILWRDLFALARQCRSLRDLARVFFGRPGTVPEGVVPVAIVPARASDEIRVPVKVYVAAQFTVSVFSALYVCVARESLPWPVKLFGLFAVLACLTTLGGLLDGRRRAWRWEIARVCVTAPVLVALALR
ncbi:MAG: sterol desaturase family protein [Myxococcales bacterium]|nr:sterol desaturase family protein [Myxococcales bacterium]